MKILRVPWIQCRADEASAELFPCTWQGRDFEIMAVSAVEAGQWWDGLSEREKREHLGMAGASGDGPLLF